MICIIITRELSLRGKSLVSCVHDNFCKCYTSGLHILQNEMKPFWKQFSWPYHIIEKTTSAQLEILQYPVCHVRCCSCSSSINKLLLTKVFYWGAACASSPLSSPGWCLFAVSFPKAGCLWRGYKIQSVWFLRSGRIKLRWFLIALPLSEEV